MESQRRDERIGLASGGIIVQEIGNFPTVVRFLFGINRIKAVPVPGPNLLQATVGEAGSRFGIVTVLLRPVISVIFDPQIDAHPWRSGGAAIDANWELKDQHTLDIGIFAG